MAEMPSLNLSVLAGGVHSLVGQTISINLKAGAYFGVPDTNIWLTPTKYWATVPGNLAHDAYDLINVGLSQGRIVRGKVFIPPVDKPTGVIDEYWEVIKKEGIGENTKAKFRKIALRHNWIDRNYTFMEIALECIAREQKTKHRPEVLKWLNMVLDQCEGPLRLYEQPDDSQEGIKEPELVPEVLESEIENPRDVPEGYTPPPPRDHVGGNASKQEALGNVLD